MSVTPSQSALVFSAALIFSYLSKFPPLPKIPTLVTALCEPADMFSSRPTTSGASSRYPSASSENMTPSLKRTTSPLSSPPTLAQIVDLLKMAVASVSSVAVTVVAVVVIVVVVVVLVPPSRTCYNT